MGQATGERRARDGAHDEGNAWPWLTPPRLAALIVAVGLIAARLIG